MGSVAGVVSAVAALVTVALAARALRYARDTLIIARETRAAAERHQSRRFLAEIQSIVESIEQAARSSPSPGAEWWSCPGMNALYVALELTPTGLDLPKCQALAEAGPYDNVARKIDEAKLELEVSPLALAGFEVVTSPSPEVPTLRAMYWRRDGIEIANHNRRLGWIRRRRPESQSRLVK